VDEESLFGDMRCHLLSPRRVCKTRNKNTYKNRAHKTERRTDIDGQLFPPPLTAALFSDDDEGTQPKIALFAPVAAVDFLLLLFDTAALWSAKANLYIGRRRIIVAKDDDFKADELNSTDVRNDGCS
jgi:hypothetical protein